MTYTNVQKQKRYRELSRKIFNWYESVTGVDRRMAKYLMEKEKDVEIEYKFEIMFSNKELVYEIWRNNEKKQV